MNGNLLKSTKFPKPNHGREPCVFDLYVDSANKATHTPRHAMVVGCYILVLYVERLDGENELCKGFVCWLIVKFERSVSHIQRRQYSIK